jgi:hypothetical protein
MLTEETALDHAYTTVGPQVFARPTDGDTVDFGDDDEEDYELEEPSEEDDELDDEDEIEDWGEEDEE